MKCVAFRGAGSGALLLALLVGGDAWTQPSEARLPPAACAPGGKASSVLDELVRAYERGQIDVLQGLLDARMAGLQTVLDAAVRERLVQTRTAIHVLDQRVQCGASAAAIAFTWEKRAQQVDGLRATLAAGSATLLLAAGTDGDESGWRVVSISDLHPFRLVSPAPPRAPAEPASPGDPIRNGDPPPNTRTPSDGG